MRMNPAPLAFVAAAVLALTAGAGAARGAGTDGRDDLDNGTPVTASWRDTGPFSTLMAAGPDTVRFEPGSVARVRAEGDPRTIERLRFLVRDGRLVVGRRSESANHEKLSPALITVTAPSIRGASVAGSGRLSIPRLTGERVYALVAGSGAMSVGALDAGDLSAKVAGSGNLAIAGRSRSASLMVAGSGTIAGQGLTAGSASAMIAGSGDAVFRSGGKVDVNITGSGTVTVSGGATCTLRRIGSGTLRCG